MAILHALRHVPGHLSPSVVFAEARKTAPSLTEPTVYRTLEFLVRNGFVWRLDLENGHLAYELAESGHHHLVCTNCGRQVEVAQQQLEAASRAVEATTGFALDWRHLRISGLCPECQLLVGSPMEPRHAHYDE
jgi:Fe2+ or Zn2+ uptake regulation protein